MKKLLLIALTSVLCLSSCSSDDSSNDEMITSTDASALIGKWRLDFYTPFTEDGITYSIEECEKESIYEYKEGGIYTYEYVLDIEDGNGTCGVDDEGTSNYTVDGNKLIVEDNQETTTTTFSITEDELTLTYENGEIERYIKTTDPLFSETETTEPTEPSEPASLIGKWRLDFYTPITEGGVTYSIEECEKESIYEYKEDGTLTYEYVLDIEDGNGTCGVDDDDTYNYTVDGNKLIVEDDQETTTVTFSISEDELTLTYENGEIDRYLKTTDPFFSETIETTESSNLIGNWKYTSGTANGIEIPLTACGDSEIVQFSDDNVYTTEDLIQEGNECIVSQLITTNYEVLGNQITLSNSTFEFNIDGDTLSLSSTVSGFEIISFFTKTTDPLFSEL